jgi:NADPH-dependent ferric siderophore reductase
LSHCRCQVPDGVAVVVTLYTNKPRLSSSLKQSSTPKEHSISAKRTHRVSPSLLRIVQECDKSKEVTTNQVKTIQAPS